MDVSFDLQTAMMPDATLHPLLPKRSAAPRSDVDRRLGGCLRAVRQARGLSQQAVAEELGLSSQQLQKYERGVNRVSVATLISLARVLDVSPTSLLASLDTGEDASDLALRERALLFEYYSRIESEKLRRQVLGLLAQIGAPETA